MGVPLGNCIFRLLYNHKLLFHGTSLSSSCHTPKPKSIIGRRRTLPISEGGLVSSWFVSNTELRFKQGSPLITILGGWWTRPKNWAANTAIAGIGIALVTYATFRVSAKHEVREGKILVRTGEGGPPVTDGQAYCILTTAQIYST